MHRDVLGNRMRRLLLILAVYLPAPAFGHALAPSLLDLRETSPGRLEVLWKTPTIVAPGAQLRPILPPGCTPAGEPSTSQEEAAFVVHWSVECDPPSLVGREIAVSGIADSRADVLLRVSLADGRSFRSVLTPDRSAYVVPERQRVGEVVRSYVSLGSEHILTGFDHLLFVLGLLLLVTAWRRLFWTLTSFTLGHSITLSLAVLGFVHVPQATAEVAIAASIFVLAVELARPPGAPETLLRRFPGIMSSLFGLLHGLGFAGALAEIGLPAGDIPLALFSFNVGIEIGQIVFVVVVIALRAAVALLPIPWPAAARLAPAYVIGSLAAFWMFERLGIAL